MSTTPCHPLHRSDVAGQAGRHLSNVRIVRPCLVPQSCRPVRGLHVVSDCGMFTGNRGPLVDEDRRVVRHHASNLWITCVDRVPRLAAPARRAAPADPLFFLDDAVALAAGHRPCSFCRRGDDHLAYKDGVSHGLGRPGAAVGIDVVTAAWPPNGSRRGRGIDRAAHRRTWTGRGGRRCPMARWSVDGPQRQRPACSATARLAFRFAGWHDPQPWSGWLVDVLTPPTSVLALSHGFSPTLHESAR